MEEVSNIWPKHLTVDKRIVKILSGSTYANFPNAIREIIVNSYDADAQNVWVDIDLDKEIITIKDDGRGMNENDFSFYLRIAGKTRKKENDLTKAKRKIIGQFGIGFLSALPFCKKYQIETKKKNSNEIVHATITSTEYFKEEVNTIDVEEIPIYGNIEKNDSEYYDQFTRIRLIGFSKLTKSFLRGDFTIKNRRNTINNFEPLELLKWQLCEYLPLTYNPNDKIGQQLNRVFKLSLSTAFNVYFKKKQLYRNLHANNILEIADEEKTIGEIKFKHVILTNYDPIIPGEARYILLRNLNVGVGDRTTFGLGLEGKIYGKLAHLTGEVFVNEGLNDLISVSRDKFNFSADYEKLKDYLRQRLSHWANELDEIKSLEKSVVDLTNKTSVASIGSLRKEHISNEITTLKNKGFSVTKSEKPENKSIKLNRETKELVLPSEFKDFHKSIEVLNKDYALSLDNWKCEGNRFPAIKIGDGNIIQINESYPLFKNNNHFDFFLKLHIILLESLRNDKIDRNAYNSLLEDLLTTFNNLNND